MIRAVLDTNILVSALITKKTSPPQQLYTAFTTQQFLLVTSPPILAEVEDVINREEIIKYHKRTPRERKAIMEQLIQLSYVALESLASQEAIIKQDPKDDKFLYAALESHAEYIVSGDHHLLNLKEYETITIVTPTDFLVILKKEQKNKKQ